MRIPQQRRTGVYLVRVRAGASRAVWPLAVAGLPQIARAAGRPRPLVVLPAITWQGLNPVDDDPDGFADTLPQARLGPASTGRSRAAACRRASAPRPAPLLRYLDRERLAYDLTTDLSLARGEGPALGNAPGVAFAGSALWLPEPLLRRLRDYVAGRPARGLVRRRLVPALRAGCGERLLQHPRAPARRTPSASARRCCAPAPRR